MDISLLFFTLLPNSLMPIFVFSLFVIENHRLFVGLIIKLLICRKLFDQILKIEHFKSL